MALSEDTNESLWDISVSGKSWIEQVEEESQELKGLDESSTLRKVTATSVVTESIELKISSNGVKKNEGLCDQIKLQEDHPLKNFTLTLEKSITKEKEEVVSEIKKEEVQKDFLQDDISLTAHLDDFRLVSPCKVENTNRTLFKANPNIKNGEEVKKESEVRVPKRKIVEDKYKGGIPDEVLMPSPSKICKQNLPKCMSAEKEVLKRKRRDHSNTSTPSRSGSGKKKILDYETDPEILARRQKQICYGKNTIGYDRYTQLVPKESRKVMHPKTPPLNLKYSRRAWDGLIRTWRQRLHFWDPPSEGGGDPACLEIPSDLSDASSTDGSQPNTPVQDWKRRTRNTVQHHSDEDEDDFMNQGCQPLPPE